MNKCFNHISLLLTCSILVLTSWQSYTVIDFYSHQKEIEIEFCENIERPELECHGQCHLKKQLGTEDLKLDKKTRIVQSSILVFQSFESLNEIELPVIEKKASSFFNTVFFIKEGVSFSVLDPPELVS